MSQINSSLDTAKERTKAESNLAETNCGVRSKTESSLQKNAKLLNVEEMKVLESLHFKNTIVLTYLGKDHQEA